MGVLYENKIKHDTYEFPSVSGTKIVVSLRKDDGNVLGVTMRETNNCKLEFLAYITVFILNLLLFHLEVIGTALFSITCVLNGLLIYLKSGSIIEETFIIIDPLGYQLFTKYVIGQKSKFIPYERVQNIFINEVIYKQKIVYLLTLLTKDANGVVELIPLFTGCKPRLKCLELIYEKINRI